MRLYEFADAEAQLGLLRIIIDNTWAAIAQQAAQQKREDAERKAQAKLKPRGKKASKGSSIRIPTPIPPLPIKPPAPTAVQPPSPLNKPSPNELDAAKPLPTTMSQLKQPPTSTAINPKLPSTPYPQPTTPVPLKAQNSLKTGNTGKTFDKLEKEEDGDDRRSKNSISILKK